MSGGSAGGRGTRPAHSSSAWRRPWLCLEPGGDTRTAKGRRGLRRAPLRSRSDGSEHAKAAISAPLDGICELALETADRRGLETFYTTVLGLRVLSRDDDRTWLACGSRARLGLWDPGEKEFGDEGGRHVHFAFSAAPGTLIVLARRLETLGIKHRGPLKHDGGDCSLYVEDPAGNVVELWDFFVRGRTVSALECASAERLALKPEAAGRWSTSPVGREARSVTPVPGRASVSYCVGWKP